MCACLQPRVLDESQTRRAAERARVGCLSKMLSLCSYFSTVELHFSGLIGIASLPDMQKIRITGFFFENGYIGSLKFGCYYLQHVPASKPFDHA